MKEQVKKMMKTGLVTTLVVTTALLSACGSGGGVQHSTHIDEPWWETTGTLNTNDDGTPKFENVSIKLTTIVAGDDKKLFENIIGEFNTAHQGQISVSVSSVNEESYLSSLRTSISNNTNPPDLLMSHAKLQKAMASEKLIQPLEDILIDTGYEIDWNNYSYVLASEAALGYDNATFTIPIDMQSEVILYNKDLLASLGDDVSVPTTRQELLDVCELFKQKYPTVSESKVEDEYYAISMPTANSHFDPYTFTTAYLQNGGSFYNEQTFRAEWTSAQNTQAFKDATEAFTSLEDAGYTKLGEGEKTAQARFYNEKTLFLVIPPWNLVGGKVLSTFASKTGTTNTYEAITEKVGGMSLSGLFALNANATYASNVYVDSHSFSICKSVKDINKKAACIYFAKWFTETAEVGVKWAEAGHSSCSDSIINNSVYSANVFVQEYMANFYDVNSVRTMGNNPYAATLVQRLSNLTAKLIKTPTTATSLIAEAQRLLNAEIDEVEDN